MLSPQQPQLTDAQRPAELQRRLAAALRRLLQPRPAATEERHAN